MADRHLGEGIRDCVSKTHGCRCSPESALVATRVKCSTVAALADTEQSKAVLYLVTS